MLKKYLFIINVNITNTLYVVYYSFNMSNAPLNVKGTVVKQLPKNGVMYEILGAANLNQSI